MTSFCVNEKKPMEASIRFGVANELRDAAKHEINLEQYERDRLNKAADEIDRAWRMALHWADAHEKTLGEIYEFRKKTSALEAKIKEITHVATV